MSAAQSLYDLLADPTSLGLLRAWPLTTVPEPPYSIDDIIPLRTEHLSAALERDEFFRYAVTGSGVYVRGLGKHPHPVGIGPISVNGVALVVETVPPNLVSVVDLPETLTSPGEGWTLSVGHELVMLATRGG